MLDDSDSLLVPMFASDSLLVPLPLLPSNDSRLALLQERIFSAAEGRLGIDGFLVLFDAT